MNIIDSSAWLEYFSDGPNADSFSVPIQDENALIVPVITVYEVFKVVLRESTENNALQAVAAMQKGRMADLTHDLAIEASRLSLQYSLPMADSIILATAKKYDCTIWTQDIDFKDIEGVNYFVKKMAASG
ncbi:putative nucleic acid-binding protein [Desulfobotulus alkaliphilus]|uniref:Putative nucleic acid-binding protein n=1 Tax=Desulfobotulus alkaliphilus TaxID=622671 RepID=A0A562RV97_9BACT|nr:type II toxin-antitoxin system VapC family toxin [Desulfobotulus alkaliphilus]TWI72987.1 putative nucleic acid-binding protein [Desulfobotulus alkaliphilus]